MSERHAAAILEEAGFTDAQTEALISVFTVHHHSHQIGEIIGLEEQLEEIGDAVEPSEEPDDEE